MFLKSLTLRGFKSFADRTVLAFEPGITVIVGPNGSGKSNVVDALAWVLGTRSAKLLRGSELADVIFAGSPSRPALGRAEVEIVIDNSDGQLGTGALGSGGSAQEYSEVRISREIDPSGESTYRINGSECRLLDIQELLSDTGMGRELHTIVGQGQLDSILHAKPEERRAFIEEAAGILKHRRRRERARRKLEHVEDHLDKLTSILRELRRQLRPLERQAEAANRHARLQADLRAVQIELATHDLVGLREEAARFDAGGEDVRVRHDEVAGELAEVEDRTERLEARLREDAPAVERAREAVERLARLRERLSGTGDLIEARRRHLLEYVEEPLAGRPPDDLRAQAAQLDARRTERVDELERARRRHEEATQASREAQAARREHERRVAAAARERARQREEYVRWQGDLRARADALEAAEAEAGRLGRQLEDLDRRAQDLREQVESVQDEIRRLDAEEWRLTEKLEEAQEAVSEAQEQLDTAISRERELERERASHVARAEALRAASSDAGDGAAALLDADIDGVRGLLAERLRIDDGAETAVAAVLGPLGGAVVVNSVDHARKVIAHLRSDELGRARVVPLRDDVSGGGSGSRAGGGATRGDGRDLDGARPIGDLVGARRPGDESVVAAVRRALAETYVVASWDRAVVLYERYPDRTFVTRHGDIAGPSGFAGGSAPERSIVLTSAAAEEAEERVADIEAELAAAVETVERRRKQLATRRAELEVATGDINESDARITGAAEQLAQLNKELDGLARQRVTVAEQRDELLETAAAHRDAMLRLREDPKTMPDDESAPELEAEAERLDALVEDARREEIDTRLDVERIEGQIRHFEESARELREEADEVEEALTEAARRRELRRHHVRRCGTLAAVCDDALEALETSLDQAEQRRDSLAGERAAREREFAEQRGKERELARKVEELRERRHEADLRRSDLQHRIDQVTERLREEFGLSPEEALAEHPGASEADRAELEEREETLERKIGLLGAVNPLALEEFHALEERHAFLSRQLEDLRASKRDLNEVIAAVDDKIREVFDEAFADVAREFEHVFGTVFPGGEGRLVLTDAEDLLTTGIEVEARPPGKRVRRLSLLSGGERSLTALALLFAIFRARPSPFYVLDEVEAALDDVNLQRLLGVLESFKEQSQLLVVTHQKPTMEVADVLYGVTMGSDAVSKVVSERMRDEESVPA